MSRPRASVCDVVEPCWVFEGVEEEDDDDDDVEDEELRNAAD
jgi:hypothetical protein